MSDLVFKLPEKVDGIYDIQPPPMTGLSGIELSLIMVGVVVFTATSAYFYWKHYYSIKNSNTRKIKRLLKSHEYRHQDSRQITYQLCHYLKNGLNIKKLNSNTPLPADIASIDNNKKRWRNFARQLSEARYKEKSDYELSEIVSESLYWLKNWSK